MALAVLHVSLYTVRTTGIIAPFMLYYVTWLCTILIPAKHHHTCITFKTVLEHCQSFLAHRHDNKLAKESYWAVLFYASILGQNDDSPWLNSLDTTKNYV